MEKLILCFDLLQATGLKGESDTEQAAKRPKLGMVADIAKPASPRPDPVPNVASPHSELPDKNISGENIASNSPKTSTNVVLQERMTSKQLAVVPMTPVGAPFLMNRYKLDHRPTAFTISPPLPTALANVTLSLSPTKQHHPPPPPPCSYN